MRQRGFATKAPHSLISALGRKHGPGDDSTSTVRMIVLDCSHEKPLSHTCTKQVPGGVNATQHAGFSPSQARR